MSRRSLAARTGAQTTAGRVVECTVVADSSAIGSSKTSTVLPDAAWPCWLGMAARIHQDQRDAPWAPSLLPGAWPGPCNNADLTSRVMPRQPVQHRLSLSITGHRQSRPLFKYVILQALQGRKRDRETCSANFIASFTNRRRVIISPFRLLPRIRVRTAHNGY